MALNIELEVSEVNTVLAALGKYDESINALSLKIKNQGDLQLAERVKNANDAMAEVVETGQQ
jgi:hypothetical protein